MKKLLSTLLAAIMILSSGLTTAFATDTIALSATKTVTVEFEDIQDLFPVTLSSGKDVNPNSKASNGDYLFTGWKSGTDVTVSIPISVPETNYYTIDYIGAYGGWLSEVKVYLDSTENPALFSTRELANNAVSLDTDGFYFHPKTNDPTTTDFPGKKYSVLAEIPAGEHTIIVSALERSSAYGGAIASAWDCISFTPDVLPVPDTKTISATGTTRIEYEDYKDFVISSGAPYPGATIMDNETTQAYASGGKILDMSEKTKLTDASITIPVYVEKEGLYDINHFIVNANKGQYLSYCTLAIDGVEISVNNSAYTELLDYPDADGNPTYASKYYPMARYASKIELTEGEHTITLTAVPISLEVNGGYGIKFHADCIEFIPYEEPKTVISGETTIEIEDYANTVFTTGDVAYTGGKIGEDARASAGKYFYIAYGNTPEAYIPIKIDVTEPGWYDVESVMHAKGGNAYVGVVTITVDGTEVLTNLNKHVAKDISEGGDFISSNFKMHEFTNRVYLEAGEQELLIYCPDDTPDEKVKFYIDYIRFAPAKTVVSFVSNKAKVRAAYDAPVQGTALAAFYKGGKLLQVAKKDITEATQIFDIDTDVASTPDTVKVFMLESFSGMKPSEKAVTVTDFAVHTPTLYLLGDSVCAHYDSYSFWQQGWGNHIMPHFGEGITVLNYAIGGRSTKTFRNDNNWANILDGIKYGDFVMINFGLNDIGSIASGKGTSIEDYEMYLNLYCDEIQEKGATPILISTIPECNTSHNSLIARANVMEKVANEQGVVFLPLNDTLNYQWILDEDGNYDTAKVKETFDYYYLSEAAFTRLEEEYGKEIPQEQWDYIATTPDRTHINIDGAQYVAQTIVDLLEATDSPLKDFLK